MIDTVYVEEAIAGHARTLRVLERFPKAEVIRIERYGEVFNRRGQNFRLQKKKPSLILAKKHDGQVLPAPDGYGIGGQHNYYFSHLLNCLYDCRYCFLQGMYRSAHYVMFVNFEDFEAAIDDALTEHQGESVYFFSGYDCDSLALESVTCFAKDFLPFFRARPDAWLELRTKSVQTKPMLQTDPFPNCVMAYSLTPEPMARVLDERAPSVARRIETMGKLARHGWSIGLRFDPLIHGAQWEHHYNTLFEEVFAAVPEERIHSVSYGPMRFPKKMHKDIVRLYPESPLLAGPTEEKSGMVAYPSPIELEMADFCRQALMKYVPDTVFFQCTPDP